jgi:hypothetical protein
MGTCLSACLCVSGKVSLGDHEQISRDKTFYEDDITNTSSREKKVFL